MDAPLLFFRFADPTDEDLDRFSSGNGEIDAYFSTRKWFDTGGGQHSPPTYQFRTEQGGEVVGYAAVAFRNNPHPSDDSKEKAKYVVVYAVGIHARFAGRKNPRAPTETYAESIFAILEGMARAKTGCVGLYLWVRSDNPRAIAFYQKVGFVADPGGPRARDEKAPHLTMRKTW